MIDLIESGSQDASINIECIVFLIIILSGIIKCICISLGQKKLDTNIDAAIDDWLSFKDKEIRKIMRKYTCRSRILTFALLYVVFLYICTSVLSVIYKNAKQIFFTDPNSANGKIWLQHSLLERIIFVEQIFWSRRIRSGYYINISFSIPQLPLM